MKTKAEISPQCALCEEGRPSPDGKKVLCLRRGIMKPDDVCRRFSYDPLKRKPKQPPKRKYDSSDFEL